jgi:hypothetical protein
VYSARYADSTLAAELLSIAQDQLRAGTGVGLARTVPLVPSPNWPNAFHPQQYARSADVTPQVCPPPPLS